MSERIKIAVCDDESRALAIVASAVEGIFADMGTEITLEKFLSPAELLDRVRGTSFDLLFLDISMPKMDGIQLAKLVKSQGNDPGVVFVSSRTDRMFDTFAAEPFGFVRKGHFMEDLNEVIIRFMEKRNVRKTGDMVCFQDGRGTVSVDISRVKYIECVRNTQVLYFDGSDTERRIYSRMEILEEELKKYGFLRIHKGYLVNCQYISRFDPKYLLLITQEQLPIGRSYYQSAKVGYLEFLSASGASYIGKNGAMP